MATPIFSLPQSTWSRRAPHFPKEEAAALTHMIELTSLKTDVYNHYDNQILKTRVSHMIKFTRLKTNEYSHYGDRALIAIASHMIKYIRLKTKEYDH